MLDLIDMHPDHRGNEYSLAMIYRTPEGEVIRVRVRREFYGHLSSAVAEVLTPARTWTELVENAASHWADTTPIPGTRPFKETEGGAAEILGGIAADLVERAYVVLSAGGREPFAVGPAERGER